MEFMLPGFGAKTKPSTVTFRLVIRDQQASGHGYQAGSGESATPDHEITDGISGSSAREAAEKNPQSPA